MEYHRRSNDELSQIPPTLKYVLIFIDRVGFAIFAFCLISYICFISIGKVNVSLQQNTTAIQELSSTIRTLKDRG